MKVKVVEENCIGCGACVAIASEIFDYNEEGLATVIIDEVPKDLEDLTTNAIESCPVSAIIKL